MHTRIQVHSKRAEKGQGERDPLQKRYQVNARESMDSEKLGNRP
jgi:hypothetical protein